MAWMLRLILPDYPYHATQRGNRRQKTVSNSSDYEYYIELISESADHPGHRYGPIT